MNNLIHKLLGTKPKPPIQPVVAKVCEMILAGDFKYVHEDKGNPHYKFARETNLPVYLLCDRSIYAGGRDVDMTRDEHDAVSTALRERRNRERLADINKALPEILAYEVKEHAP